MTFEKWLATIIKGRSRELRSSELLSIWVYLGVNPMDFAEDGKEVE